MCPPDGSACLGHWQLWSGLVQYFDAADSSRGAPADAAACYRQLTTADQLIGVAVMLPMLRQLRDFILQCQERAASPIALKQAVATLLQHLDRMYIKPATAFSSEDFPQLQKLQLGGKDSIVCHNDEAHVCLRVKVKTGGDDAASYEQLHELVAVPVHVPGQRGGNRRHAVPVEVQAYEGVQDRQKKAGTAAAQLLKGEVNTRFPKQQALDAFQILTLAFWGQDKPPTEEEVQEEVEKLTGEWGTDKPPVKAMLDADALVDQLPSFRQWAEPIATKLLKTIAREEKELSEWKQKLAEQKAAGVKRRDMSGAPAEQPPPMTRFFCELKRLGGNSISEWLRAGELVITLVPGSVEEERTFSAMNFIKDEHRNRLDEHLETAVRLFCQRSYSITTFPYIRAIEHWEEQCTRGRYNMGL